MATYTIFAGVNGAGKTSIYQSIYYEANKSEERINTDLSGKSIIKTIKKAKEKGFYIVMNYIGVDNPDIAKERVRIRVSKGGHGIQEEVMNR